MDKTKKCKTCGEEFPATTEYFRKTKDGLRGKCKNCTAEDKKQWDIKNKEHCSKYREDNAKIRSEYNKEYRKNNKERVSEYHKKYNQINKDVMSITRKKYKKNNKDIISIKRKQYRLDNSDKIKESNKQYKANNKDRVAIDNQKRRSRKKLLPATLTLSEWEFIKNSFSDTCCYCGRKLPITQEHYVAVINLGGYELGNIVPACQSCNSSKGAKYFEDWYPTHESYSSERESKILEFIEKTKEMNIINNSKVA